MSELLNDRSERPCHFSRPTPVPYMFQSIFRIFVHMSFTHTDILFGNMLFSFKYVLKVFLYQYIQICSIVF